MFVKSEYFKYFVSDGGPTFHVILLNQTLVRHTQLNISFLKSNASSNKKGSSHSRWKHYSFRPCFLGLYPQLL